ncbi:hypothetical protein HUJ04_010075 [Dendroctonus ponderosae]|nr:hypothetical protein HUJ04_010075 [Dendroctonus ponderosae]
MYITQYFINTIMLESFHPIESALEIAVIAYSQVSASERSGNNSVLANHPDITLIKKEKTDGPVNNNSDHSESGSDKSGAYIP